MFILKIGVCYKYSLVSGVVIKWNLDFIFKRVRFYVLWDILKKYSFY